jgi:hypothetical protein
MSQESRLFPVPNQTYLGALMEFGRYTDDELTMIEANNEAIPPEDNASLFVLRMNMRPELLAGDTEADELRRHAYKVGALLGRRIIKSLIEIDDDGDFVTITDEQREEVLHSVRSNQRDEFVPSQERNLLGMLDGQLSDHIPGFGFHPYIQADGEMLFGFLRAGWERSEVPFFLDEQTKHLAGDQVPRGMKDMFRLFAYLEDSRPRNWSVNSEVGDKAAEQETVSLEHSSLGEHIKYLRGDDNNLSDEEKLDLIYAFAEVGVQHRRIQRLERISDKLGKCAMPVATSVPPVMMGGSLLVQGGNILHAAALSTVTAIASVGGGLVLQKIMNRIR